MFQSILMVCVGNICRSPMAEYVLRHKLAAMSGNRPGIEVASAGIGALVDRPADPHTVTVLSAAGMDCSAHRARQISRELATSHDLILAMESRHIEDIYDRHPYARGKVHLLGKWNDGEEIGDPYKKDLGHFQKVYQQVERGCDAWLKRLY